MIPDFRGRVGAAGDFPAAEVLGADGEAEEVVCIWVDAVQVGGHFLGVVEFVGGCCVVGCDFVGVVLVRLVDAREREIVFGHFWGDRRSNVRKNGRSVEMICLLVN